MQVTWSDRRGAGRMRAFSDAKECIAFLATLRCEATVHDSSTGETVGAVEYAPGIADDRRVKWIWYLETDAR